MPWLAVPAFGAVAGVVKAKVPGAEAVPPVRVEFASVWPKVIVDAVGAWVISTSALLTVTVTKVVVPRRLLATLGVNVTLCVDTPILGIVSG